MRVRAPERVLRLVIDADLCETSFREACSMLAEGELPLMLAGRPDQFGEGFCRWLWENSRITSYWTLPTQALAKDCAWFLEGNAGTVVISGAP